VLVAANWKMHFVRAEAEAWCAALRAGLRPSKGVRALVFPSSPLLATVAAALAGSGVEVGGQDLHPEDRGAHTGEVSGAQLRDAGCRWVLCGHSERRRDHHESDEWVGRKVAAAAGAGLVPMLCVGETREERRAGQTERVLTRQLHAGLADLPDDALFAVAYEPVWAIGTGETASPETAQQAQAFLRMELGERPAEIVYGGSVTPENAAALAVQPAIDGFLVGGASLDPARFLAIIRACG
jgi:triosephosphate isomerase